MQAGVDHQPAGAEQRPVQLAEVADRIAVIPAVLDGQLLRIERPALDVGRAGRERGAAAEVGQVPGLHLDRELEVVARDGLVVNEGPHVRDVVGGAGQRCPEHARLGAVRRRGRVVGGGGGLGQRGLAAHLDGRFRHDVEQQPGARLRVAQVGGVAVQQLDLRGGVLGLAVGVHLAIALLDAAFDVAQLAQQAVHLGFDAGDLLQADRVDLGRRELGGGVGAQPRGVEPVAIGQAPDAGVVGGPRQLRAQQREAAAPRRHDGARDDGLGPRAGALAGGVVHVGQGRHALRQRRHQRVVRRLRRDELLDLADGGRGDEARHQHALGLRGAGADDALVHQRGQAVHALQVAAHVGRVAHRVFLHEEGDRADMHAGHVLEDVGVVEELALGDVLPHRPGHQRGGGALRRRQRVAREARQLGQGAAVAGDVRELVLARERIPLPVEAGLDLTLEVLHAGGVLRRMPHALGGDAFGPGVEAGGAEVVRGGGRCGQGLHRRRGQHAAQSGREHAAAAHGGRSAGSDRLGHVISLVDEASIGTAGRVTGYSSLPGVRACPPRPGPPAR